MEEENGPIQTLKEGQCVQMQVVLARGSQVRLYQEGKNGPVVPLRNSSLYAEREIRNYRRVLN